ncbi:hypothetical protein [Micromonospora sp. NPDC005367]|uniref:hypothetical protein n=1 Tax=Micromonospora sp. NPDC005367 TaxID=3155590 RepID=UPI00339F8352
MTPGSTAESAERVQAAVLFLSRRDSQQCLAAAALAQQDRRDVLVGVGFADDDWVDQLNRLLGDASSVPMRQ